MEEEEEAVLQIFINLIEGLFRLKFERSQRAKNDAPATQLNEAVGYNGANINGQPVAGKMDANEARMVAEARATLAPQPTPSQVHALQPPPYDVSQSSRLLKENIQSSLFLSLY